MKNLLKVENLSKIYLKNRKPALKDVSFSLEKGNIIGILGLNGAGKTTCLKMISGLIYPTEGKIEFMGKNLWNSPHKMRKHIGYLPEGNPLWEDVTPLEYLNLRAKFLKLKTKQKQIDEILELTQLKDVSKVGIWELSSGYKQRTGLAATFLGWPELLVLDEPARGLDPLQIESLRFLIKEAAKKSTILISSHVLDELERTASRFLVLKEGKLIFDNKLDPNTTLREFFIQIHKEQ